MFGQTATWMGRTGRVSSVIANQNNITVAVQPAPWCFLSRFSFFPLHPCAEGLEHHLVRRREWIAKHPTLRFCSRAYRIEGFCFSMETAGTSFSAWKLKTMGNKEDCAGESFFLPCVTFEPVYSRADTSPTTNRRGHFSWVENQILISKYISILQHSDNYSTVVALTEPAVSYASNSKEQIEIYIYMDETC